MQGSKTLLLATPYFPPEGGGLENYASNIGRELAHAHAWRVVVVTTGPQRRGVVREHNAGITIYRLPAQLQISNTRLGLSWRRLIKRIAATEQPDLLNVHAPVPGIADIAASALPKLPLVVTWHAGSMRKGRQPADSAIWMYEHLLRPRLFRRAASIICSSDYVRDEHLTTIREKTHTITPAVDDPGDEYAATEPVPGRLVFVAALDRGSAHKGLDVLIRALGPLRQRCPEVSLQVVGDGRELPRYQEAARMHAVDDIVTFSGRMSGRDLSNAYAASIGAVLPTRNDSLPLVLLEAMATGRPVVATRVGSIPQLVDDGVNGFLVEPDDVNTLVDRIAALLTSPKQTRAMGAAARDKVRNEYRWDRQSSLTATLFDEVIKSCDANVAALSDQMPHTAR